MPKGERPQDDPEIWERGGAAPPTGDPEPYYDPLAGGDAIAAPPTGDRERCPKCRRPPNSRGTIEDQDRGTYRDCDWPGHDVDALVAAPQQECPECGGRGWLVRTVSAHAYNCDCDGANTTCPVPEQEQYECPWPGHRAEGGPTDG